MMTKSQRTVLSCRVPQELKQQISDAAAAEGTTTSNYLEQIIFKYETGEHISEDKEEEYLLRIQQLENKLIDAERDRVQQEHNITEYEDEVFQLMEEKQELATACTAIEEALQKSEQEKAELERRLPNMTSAERNQMSEYMEYLKQHYPAATEEQIVIGSLYAAKENQEGIVFVVSRVKDYFKTF